MLNNLLSKTLKEEKDPDKRMWQIVLLITVPVLFWITMNALSDNNKDCKQENRALRKEIAALKEDKKRDDKIKDSLKDANYSDRLNFYIEKEKYSKQIDSLIINLQKIK